MDLVKLTSFELEKKHTIIAVLIILALYFGSTYNELFVDDCPPGFLRCHDLDRRMARLYVWDINEFFNDFRHSLHFGLLVLSREVFGNYKILSWVSSGVLLLLTYLFTLRITQRRFAGLIAMVVLLQSTIFRDYATSVTYPSFWAVFYIFGLYLMLGKWQLAPLSSILAIPAKSLSGLFLPAAIIFAWFSDIDKPRKKRILLVYSIIMIAGLSAAYYLYDTGIVRGTVVPFEFKPMKFVAGIGDWANSFRTDRVSFVLLITVIPSLFLIKNIPYSKSLLFLLLAMLMVSPFLRGFTSYDNWPYRFLPHVVIIAVSSGLIFTNVSKLYYELFRFNMMMSKPKIPKAQSPQVKLKSINNNDDEFKQYY